MKLAKSVIFDVMSYSNVKFGTFWPSLSFVTKFLVFLSKIINPIVFHMTFETKFSWPLSCQWILIIIHLILLNFVKMWASPYLLVSFFQKVYSFDKIFSEFPSNKEKKTVTVFVLFNYYSNQMIFHIRFIISIKWRITQINPNFIMKSKIKIFW